MYSFLFDSSADPANGNLDARMCQWILKEEKVWRFAIQDKSTQG